MRYVKIRDLQPGMELGIGIVDLSGAVIIKQGNELSEKFIARLDEDGYDGVYINDNLGHNIAIDDRYSAYNYASKFDAVVAEDVRELMRVAISIVDDIIRNRPERICIQNVFNYKEQLYYHSVNVAIYSTMIGFRLGLDRDGLYYLAKAAILHDIGMAELPEEMRYQNESDSNNQKLLKQHVENSVIILRQAGVEGIIVEAVQAHHENENGTGYPLKLESAQIHDFAKIIHVADVLADMTTRHPGKNAYLPADALDYLSSGAGILFHEGVVRTALECFDAYPIGAEVTLSDDRKAIIIGRTENNMRPVIMLKATGEKVRLSDNPEYKFVAIKSSAFGDVKDDAKDEKPATEESSLNLASQPKRKPVIAVVDDVYICRRTVEAALNSEFVVKSFENALSAMAFIRKNPVDLVVMDIEMPEVNGITAVRQLREEGFTKLPVIFLTSVNDRKTVVDCLSSGAVDYILKPIKQIYVYERVKEALSGI